MKIKSSFKDYYDHVAHKYGGGDPNVVYVRHRLKPLVDLGVLKYDEGIPFDFKVKRDLHLIEATKSYLNTEYQDYKFKYLVIAAKWYLLVSRSTEEKFHVLSKEKHQKLVETLTKRKRWSQQRDFGYYVGCEDPQLIDLSRLVNTPVFIIAGYERFWKLKKVLMKVEGNIPILADLGIAAIYPAEQIYQDLAYFVGNKIHESPDANPPVSVSNKDKILQFGFDLKTSFRHPVK